MDEQELLARWPSDLLFGWWCEERVIAGNYARTQHGMHFRTPSEAKASESVPEAPITCEKARKTTGFEGFRNRLLVIFKGNPSAV